MSNVINLPAPITEAEVFAAIHKLMEERGGHKNTFIIMPKGRKVTVDIEPHPLIAGFYAAHWRLLNRWHKETDGLLVMGWNDGDSQAEILSIGVTRGDGVTRKLPFPTSDEDVRIWSAPPAQMPRLLFKQYKRQAKEFEQWAQELELEGSNPEMAARIKEISTTQLLAIRDFEAKQRRWKLRAV